MLLELTAEGGGDVVVWFGPGCVLEQAHEGDSRQGTIVRTSYGHGIIVRQVVNEILATLKRPPKGYYHTSSVQPCSLKDSQTPEIGLDSPGATG